MNCVQKALGVCYTKKICFPRPRMVMRILVHVQVVAKIKSRYKKIKVYFAESAHRGTGNVSHRHACARHDQVHHHTRLRDTGARDAEKLRRYFAIYSNQQASGRGGTFACLHHQLHLSTLVLGSAVESRVAARDRQDRVLAQHKLSAQQAAVCAEARSVEG